MKKILTLLLAATLATSALAKKPSYTEARRLYNEMERYQSITGLWHTKSAVERIALAKKAAVLGDQVKKLWAEEGSQMWPVGGSCTSAATFLSVYVSNLNTWARFYSDGASMPNSAYPNTLASNAYYWGRHMANCYNDVEALDPRNK